MTKIIGIGTMSTDNLNQSQIISKTLGDNIRKVMTITKLFGNILQMSKIEKIKEKKLKIIGIWGYPDPSTLKAIRLKYPNYEIIDLDVNYNASLSGIIPDAYCKIISNIIDNALYLKDNLELIIASVGEEKCDGARFAAAILKDLGFNIIETKYNNSTKSFDTPISESNLPLKQKIIKIMDGILYPNNEYFEKSTPIMGFWGVPPNDVDILTLFPDATHVFGWTRAVEAGRPSDINLEMFVPDNLPTVFFSQTFCQKTELARYLAKKHYGLYVDIDDTASNSVKAKIEAFIRLG